MLCELTLESVGMDVAAGELVARKVAAACSAEELRTAEQIALVFGAGTALLGGRRCARSSSG